MSTRDELIEIVARDPQSAGGDAVWATDLVDAVVAEALRVAEARILGLRREADGAGNSVEYLNGYGDGFLIAADVLHGMAAAPAVVLVASDEAAADSPAVEFGIRFPDESTLIPAVGRAHAVSALESARRAEPGAVLMTRTCTSWREVSS